MTKTTKTKNSPSVSLRSIQQQRYGRLALSTSNGDQCLLRHLHDFNNGILPRASSVDEEFLRNFSQYLLERVKPNSARTYLQKLYAMLRASLRNQGFYVALPRICDLVPAYEVKRRTALSIKELEQLKQAACPHPSTARAFFFSCYTGLRISDISTLEWQHIVDFGDGPCVVKRQVKTHCMVEIPLGHHALDLLPPRVEWADARRSEGSKRIFEVMSRSTLRTDLIVWAQRAGIRQTITFHCARHTFASLLLASNAELYVISKLCGHQRVATTEVYLHLLANQRSHAIAQMECMMSDPAKNPSKKQKLLRHYQK